MSSSVNFQKYNNVNIFTRLTYLEYILSAKYQNVKERNGLNLLSFPLHNTTMQVLQNSKNKFMFKVEVTSGHICVSRKSHL